MKIQQVQNSKFQQNSNTFKGAVDTTLLFLAENQAIGANAVDLCSMVIPRTASDTLRRGVNAGLETGRREGMGTVNDSSLGLYGMGAGALLTYAINKKYGISANAILAAPETLDILAGNKIQQIRDNKSQKEYFRNTFTNLKAYNPTSPKADKDGYIKLSEELIDKLSTIMDDVVSNEKVEYSNGVTDIVKGWFGKEKKQAWNSNKTNNSRKVVANLITEETGAQSKFILESADKKKISETTLDAFTSDIFKVSKMLNAPKVKEAFEKQVRENKSLTDNAFMKSLTKTMRNKSWAGFALGAAVGLSVQPINIYLTKLKTGTDGFVGVEGRTKDTSKSFFAAKLASGIGFMGLVLKTLNCHLTNLKNLPSEFMGKMAFKGLMPTISQLKGIYGLTIFSRFMAARDKDELREAMTKDIPGYFSWLILGDIVNRLVANAYDSEKTPILNTKEAPVKGVWNNIKRAYNSTIKTRYEVLLETLKEHNISSVKEENGKHVAKTFKDMYKDLDKLPTDVAKITKKRLSVLNKAQVTGYLVSGLILGLGIPNLNIYITNTLDKKRKAKKAQQEEQKSAQNI